MQSSVLITMRPVAVVTESQPVDWAATNRATALRAYGAWTAAAAFTTFSLRAQADARVGMEEESILRGFQPLV